MTRDTGGKVSPFVRVPFVREHACTCTQARTNARAGTRARRKRHSNMKTNLRKHTQTPPQKYIDRHKYTHTHTHTHIHIPISTHQSRQNCPIMRTQAAPERTRCCKASTDFLLFNFITRTVGGTSHQNVNSLARSVRKTTEARLRSYVAWKM